MFSGVSILPHSPSGYILFASPCVLCRVLPLRVCSFSFCCLSCFCQHYESCDLLSVKSCTLGPLPVCLMGRFVTKGQTKTTNLVDSVLLDCITELGRVIQVLDCIVQITATVEKHIFTSHLFSRVVGQRRRVCCHNSPHSFVEKQVERSPLALFTTARVCGSIDAGTKSTSGLSEMNVCSHVFSGPQDIKGKSLLCAAGSV